MFLFQFCVSGSGHQTPDHPQQQPGGGGGDGAELCGQRPHAARLFAELDAAGADGRHEAAAQVAHPQHKPQPGGLAARQGLRGARRARDPHALREQDHKHRPRRVQGSGKVSF